MPERRSRFPDAERHHTVLVSPSRACRSTGHTTTVLKYIAFHQVCAGRLEWQGSSVPNPPGGSRLDRPLSASIYGARPVLGDSPSRQARGIGNVSRIPRGIGNAFEANPRGIRDV